MDRLPVEELLPGMVVAQSVMNARGDDLVRGGTVLTDHRIGRLHELGFRTIPVFQGSGMEGLALHETLNTRTRSSAVRKLHGLFDYVADREERIARSRGSTPRDVVRQAEQTHTILDDVSRSVGDILDETLTGDLLLGVGALKSLDSYAFHHGIDVAVTGALLARKLWWPDREIRSVVAGCLVIDIGNLAVPPDLRQHDGHLHGADQRLVHLHTGEGYEILGELGWQDPLARHIPYQHHERQDGGGYPRGLRGTNRAVRTPDENRRRDLILPLAEVAAIVDVYDALTSDRPYRAALSVEEAVQTLKSMADTHLNREMVASFLSIVPLYSVGLSVRLSGGRGPSGDGYILAQDPRNPARPVVRLRTDAQGQPRRADVRTHDDPDIVITPQAAAATAPPAAPTRQSA